MISGFFRLVLYLFLACVIVVLIRLVFFRARPGHTNRRAQKAPGVMVKDEACNTYLPREQAIRERIDGKDYFFCSPECHRNFLNQRKDRA